MRLGRNLRRFACADARVPLRRVWEFPTMPLLLFLRKRGSVSEVFIVWDDYLGNEAYVTWRIGTDQPQSRQWTLSTDSQSTFYPEDAVALIRSISKVDRFVVRLTPYNENPATAVFDVRGLASLVGEVDVLVEWRLEWPSSLRYVSQRAFFCR